MTSFVTARPTRLVLLLTLALSTTVAFATDRALLEPETQAQFVQPLPIPSVLTPDETTFPGFDYYEISMTQFRQDLGLIDPSTSLPLLTTVWGYGGSYPGPTIEAHTTLDPSGRAVRVLWRNELVDGGGNPLPHLLPVDPTVHCGPGTTACAPFNRTVTHLHGGHVESASDGYPEAWFTPRNAITGPMYEKALYEYGNDQEATTLWYHDHAMGITRLNVYAGLAGFYLLRDDFENQLIASGLLPARQYEVPLVIQDRSFYSDGSLAYPSENEGDDGEETSEDGTELRSIEPEAFGDFILVNGKLWPVLEVEPRKYRFRILNGSDSRFYDLWLDSGQSFWQIGTDGGFLDAPVAENRFLLAPAERADVLIDFSDPSLAGRTIILRNNARSPYPRGEPVDPKTTGRVMAFRVSLPLSAIPDVSVPVLLRPQTIAPLIPNANERTVVLFEGTDPLGRLRPQLGTDRDGALLWDDAITENPMVGDIEVWNIVNTTPDTHPIHLHLVQFQILDRQRFQIQKFEAGHPESLRFIGRTSPPDSNEAGWKDTVRVPPGTVTRIIARFDLAGLYVWHCHILSHEDHEMMRPYYVGSMP